MMIMTINDDGCRWCQPSDIADMLMLVNRNGSKSCVA